MSHDPSLLEEPTIRNLIALGVLNADGLLNGLRYAEVSLTNAQILDLTTPVTLVDAPGAGKVNELVGGCIINDYTGGYTESGDNLAVKYTDASGAAASEDIEMTGFADATADKVIKILPKKDVLMVPNAALVLDNTGSDFGSGNAANVWRVKIAYRVHDTDL